MKKLFIIFLLLIFIQAKSFAQNINIAFTIDNNYPIFTLITIYSILENNNAENEYSFFIVENNLSSKNKNLIENYIKSRGQKVSFIKVETVDIDKGNNVYAFLKKRITRIGMARILLPEILPKNVKRVLYLDSDVIVSDDISVLYNMPLEGKLVGMVKDGKAFNDYIEKMKCEKNEAPKDIENYYNSGVMLMDVDKWRKEKISSKLVDFFNQNINSFSYNNNKKPTYMLPDQDLINLVLKGKIKELPPEWNNQTNIYKSLSPNLKGLHHYLGGLKPWHFWKTKSIAYNLYYDYWYRSPFKKYKYYYYFKALPIIYCNNIIHVLQDIYIRHFYFNNILINREDIFNIFHCE